MKKTIAFSLFILSVLFSQAFDKPAQIFGNATFTTSSDKICPGDSITFTATDANQIAYLWKINNMVFSQNRIAGIRLMKDTTYTITLIAADFGGLDSVVKTIEVVTPPDFGFTSFIEESCPGSQDGELAINITSGTGPFSILWSTGDTTAAIAQLSGGIYHVWVYDTVGCEARDTLSLSTLNGIQAVINGNTAIRGRACKGDSVFFTNSSALTHANTSFSWFKDGIQVAQTLDYGTTFPDTGTFQIMLAGEVSICYDTAYLSMHVTDPVAGYRSSAGDQVCPGELVQFTNTSLRANDYKWYTGSTLFSQQLNPSYGFSSNGIQLMSMVASDGACADTVNWFVNVFAPTASFMASTPGPICQGEVVNFTNSSAGAVSYSWRSNNVQFSQNANPSYNFPMDGSFQIDMIATDSVCADTASFNILVNKKPVINAQVTGESCDGDANGQINLQLTGNGPFAPTWSHGPTVPFINQLSVGSYYVEVEDAKGCKSRDTFEIQTLGGVTASYSSQLQTPGVYDFTDQSMPTPSSWLWKFGDGDISPMQNPTHTYSSSGSYEICLIVTDAFGCKDTSCATLSVTVGLDKQLMSQLQLFPNPAQDFVVLQMEGMAAAEWDLQIFDQLGREVMREQIFSQGKVKMNIAHLPAGAYTFLMKGEKRYAVGKLIKQ